MFEEYKKHVAERAKNGIPAKPLTAQQVSELITLLALFIFEEGN